MHFTASQEEKFSREKAASDLIVECKFFLKPDLVYF